jgi:hypothetical protein
MSQDVCRVTTPPSNSRTILLASNEQIKIELVEADLVIYPVLGIKSDTLTFCVFGALLNAWSNGLLED